MRHRVAIYLMTGDRVEAEDIAQEAMVRVYERWDRVSRRQQVPRHLIDRGWQGRA